MGITSLVNLTEIEILKLSTNTNQIDNQLVLRIKKNHKPK